MRSAGALFTTLILVGCFSPDTPSVEGGTTEGGTADPTGPDAATGGPSTASASGGTGTSMTAPGTTGTETSDGSSGDPSGASSSSGEGSFCGLNEPLLAFSERDVYDLGGSVGWLYPTDIYGDHGTHIVAANLNLPQVDLLQNTRLIGSFDVSDTIDVVEDARAAVGDINGNGTDDVVVSSRDTVEAFFFDGDDLLGSGQVALPSSNVWALAVADFAGSGFGDVAIQDNGGAPSVDFLLGTGAGIDAPSGSVVAGRRTTAMVPAFIDGDDQIDLVVADTDADRSVSPDAFTVLLNRSDGEDIDFATASYQTDPTPWGLGVADLNGDAAPDVVTASQGEGLPDGDPDTLQVFINDGEGDFTAMPAIPVADALGQVAFGDLDCDGELDVAVTSADGIYVLRGDGAALGDPELVVAVDGVPLSVAVGRFNSDDRLDMVFGTADTGEVFFYVADDE